MGQLLSNLNEDEPPRRESGGGPGAAQGRGRGGAAATQRRDRRGRMVVNLPAPPPAEASQGPPTAEPWLRRRTSGPRANLNVRRPPVLVDPRWAARAQTHGQRYLLEMWREHLRRTT